MQYTLAMTFLATAGEKSALSVSGVKAALTKDKVNIFRFLSSSTFIS